MTPQTRHDLLHLLEALCEERLTPEQHAQLDRLVVTNAEARRIYVDYIALHGMLTWDVASAAGQPVAPLKDVPPGRRRRLLLRAGVGVIAVAAAALLVALLLHTPRNAANRPEQPVANTDDVVDPAAGTDSVAVNPPIVLGNPPVRASAGEPAISAASPERRTAVDPQDFAPIDVQVALPPVAAINAALESGWERADVQPSPVADDAEWMRRIYLDLAGRIPSADEAHAFLDNADSDKRSQLVDTLLESPETARNFATSWTNLLVGRAPDPSIDRPALHRYLQDQFAGNRPWSETVTALITAEGAASDNGPANFLLAHLNNEAVPATAVTARCFLGLQVQCTQCHAHPFYKEWGQDQFWELNSFFQQTAVERKPSADGKAMTLELVNRTVGGPTFYENRNGEMKVAFPRFAETEVDPGAATNRRAALADLLLAGDRPQLARAFVNRTWAHFFGYGFINPIDDMGPHNPATHPGLLDRLADEFTASNYDVRSLCRMICNSEPYQLSSRPGDSNAGDDPTYGDPPLFSRMYLKPLTAEQLYDSLQVATLSDTQPGRLLANTDAQRQAWIVQFFAAEQTDENCESTTFGGTLPQALTMMNGDLVSQAVSSAGETRFRTILAGTPDESERIRRICLAVLSRPPTKDEVASIREFLRRSVRQQVQTGRAPNAKAAVEESLRDLYWAYLNSSEFVVNH